MIARCGRRLLLRVALLLAVGLLLLFRTSLPQAPHRIRGWASPVARERQRPHNLLLITLDTMRADRLPAYGFDAVETPTLDRLATGGVVFEETFAAVPLTMPSHATLFTGLYPPKLSVRDNADAPLLPHFESLAELLRDRGLTTGAFIASGVLTRSRGLDQGFAVYDDELPPSCSGRRRARRSANEVVDHALSWFARAAPEPFFVWIHFYDTHRPYELPSEFSRRYQDPYLAAIAFEDAQIAQSDSITLRAATWRRTLWWLSPVITANRLAITGKKRMASSCIRKPFMFRSSWPDLGLFPVVSAT